MKTIEKKILPKYFVEVVNGNKKFEIRKDEDNIQIGDRLRLREWNGTTYTGKEVECVATYILRQAEQYGLKNGYCIIAIKKEGE